MRVKSVVQRGIDTPQAPGTGVHRAPQRAGPREHSLIASAEDFGVALECRGTRPADPSARDHVVPGPCGVLVVDFVPQHDPSDIGALRRARGGLPVAAATSWTQRRYTTA